MKLSVIMPIYRPQKVWPLFVKSIKGIENQDFCDFEFIAVIDGKDLKSKKYIENNYNRGNVKIFTTKKTNGPAISMNVGASKASGRFLIFHDQDDFSEKNRFSVLTNEIEKRNVRMVGSSFYEDFYIKFFIIKSKVVEKHSGSILKNPYLLSKKKVPFHFPTAIIDKSFFFEMGGFEPLLAQDIILCIKSCLFNELIYGHSVPILNTPLFHWCRTDKSISNSNGYVQIIEKNRKKALSGISAAREKILKCNDRAALIKMLDIKNNMASINNVILI